MMSSIANLRHHFAVMVVDFDEGAPASLSEAIGSLGYQVATYNSVESALEAVSEMPPHIIVFDYEKGEHLARHFLREVKLVSDEIKVVILVSSEQTLPALQLIGKGLAYDSVARPLASTMQVIQALDRCATTLYHQFESEQLKQHLQSIAGGSLKDNKADSVITSYVNFMTMDDAPDVSAPAAAPVSIEVAPSAVQPSSELGEFLDRMIQTKDLDETVQIFLESISKLSNDSHVLYMKYLASHASLVVSQSFGPPIEKLRGIGLDLKKETPATILQTLREPEKSQLLKDMVKNVFARDQFVAVSHLNEGEGQGVFLVLGKIDFADPIVAAIRQVFDLAWKRNLTIKEKHLVDVTDPQTSLINRKHFLQKLDDEISRSRRLLLPLSLIVIDIDGFRRVNDKLGYQQADAVLKAIGTILKKTTRVNDWVARIGADEIACLLPHTPHAGAVVKAERIRRIIEATRFPILQNHPDLVPVTVSIGVSEYPSFCNDAEGLLRSSDEALAQVKSGVGNRVCLASAPLGFKIDFTPREVPPGGGMAGMRRSET